MFSDNGIYGTEPVVGDFNNDGNADVALADVDSDQLVILISKGDGTFRPELIYTTDQFPVSPIVADFNGDGNLDLGVSANHNEEIFLGNGDGTFASPLKTAADIPIDCAPGDFNRDGKVDFVLGGQVFLGNGDGTFQPPQTVYSDFGSVRVADLDGNNRLDIAYSSESAPNIVVLRGRGNGTFGEGVAYPIGSTGSGRFVLSDLNGDARPEAIVDTLSSSLAVLINATSRR